MNGSFPRAYFTFAGSPPAPHPGADWKRLYAALIVSCLLHAALLLMPDFGTSAPVSRPAARSAQKPGAARALDVSLQQASGSAATAAGKSAARGADLLPIRAPTYYRTDELTKPPRPTAEPRRDVPRSVARSVTGKVVLKLWISALGKVDSVEVESSNLPDTVSELTAAAFGKVRFLPGEIDGRRVRALMRIEVAYVNGKRPPP
jgi:outer membrane biosynthesis protein TonB